MDEPAPSFRVLVADPDARFGARLRSLLSADGIRCDAVRDAGSAAAALDSAPFDLVLLDAGLASDPVGDAGGTLLAAAGRLAPDAAVLVVTEGWPDEEAERRLEEDGAHLAVARGTPDERGELEAELLYFVGRFRGEAAEA